MKLGGFGKVYEFKAMGRRGSPRAMNKRLEAAQCKESTRDLGGSHPGFATGEKKNSTLALSKSLFLYGPQLLRL